MRLSPCSRNRGRRWNYGVDRYRANSLCDSPIICHIQAHGRDPPLSRWQLLATLSKITSLQHGDAVTDWKTVTNRACRRFSHNCLHGWCWLVMSYASWFLNDRLLFFSLSPGQGGMACQADIPDIWSILILDIIELR